MSSVGVQAQVAAQPQQNFLSTDSALRTVVLALLLVIPTIAVYAPVHNHPFTNIDDPKYVTENPHIVDGLTLSAVVWGFTHGYAGNWHPLTWVSHAADISMFGFDAAGHHDENVAFHALNAVLLFLVLKRATGYTWRSFMVAALFALHPLNVESVAWVAERKTMLSTLFCLLALGAYRWYAMKPSVARYTVVSGLFVLGLMSKPQIIMLPLVLLAWDYWPLQRMYAVSATRPSASGEIPPKPLAWLIKEKLPLFFICMVDAGVTLIAQHVTGGAQPYTLWIRIENALVSYTRYIRKAFWPTNLALYYPHPGSSLSFWQVAGAILVLLTITVFALRARRHRYLIVGWLWFLIMLVPMIGLVQADVQGMADRYAYVSFVGLFIMICWGIADWAQQRHLPPAVLPIVSVAVLASLAAVTYRQVGFWKDDVTLWSHSARVTTGNWKAEYMLGLAQQQAGLQSESISSFMRAAEINPTDPFTNLAIAVYEQSTGNAAMAIEYYKRVLPQAWNSEQRGIALLNMARLYDGLGDTADANDCRHRMRALPQRKVNWQGAWWQQIMPLIKQYFGGHSAS